MKKIKILAIIVLIALCSINVCAAGEQVQLIGENEIEKGQTQTMTLKVTNDEAVGVVEGNITYDSNIESIEVSPSYNGWTITYNPNGKFNALKPEGAKEAEVLQITYKLKENATTGTITINDINLTTINYHMIEVQSLVTKTIQLKSQNGADNPTPTTAPTTTPAETQTPTPTITPKANPTETENTQDLGKANTSNEADKQDGKEQIEKRETAAAKLPDSTTVNKPLPKTGQAIGIIAVIIVIAVIAFIMYKKKEYYKES